MPTTMVFGLSGLGETKRSGGAHILRATGLDGEVYHDPSEDLLYMLMEDLQTPGDSFVVERVEPGREGSFMIVTRREDGSSALEGPEAKGLPRGVSMRAVHAALTRWAFDLPSWREALTDPPPEAR
jgi:hypothetical protein